MTLSVAMVAELACFIEVICPKPGNIGPGKPYGQINEMSLLVSAMGFSEAFRDAEAPLGRVVTRAAQASKNLVGRETSRGTILLLSPLVKAAHEIRKKKGHLLAPRASDFRAAAGDILSDIKDWDASSILDIFRSAQTTPGGSENSGSDGMDDGLPLAESMKGAMSGDSVAREYATGYEITFGITVPCLETLWNKGHALKRSIQQTALVLLSEVPDTEIARHFGEDESIGASEMAGRAVMSGGYFSAEGRRVIKALRAHLEDPEKPMPPTATADLTAAGVFVFLERTLSATPLSKLLERWDYMEEG
ncbi:MAG: triphosphoribosyl-dephospho-CoA synthase [Synergistaceae bacterium]|jgi:triphosphoribosyl-dephospho-CoA synthetase|nr:triphosphoribosyl-dephospho-CoA synthase [Synergistaceae bacterium]